MRVEIVCETVNEYQDSVYDMITNQIFNKPFNLDVYIEETKQTIFFRAEPDEYSDKFVLREY